MAIVFSVPSHTNFNPRSLHGERRAILGSAPAPQEFQSTLPARGATIAAPQRRMFWQVFQSTLPARGATREIQRKHMPITFQSTLPARGATALSSSAISRASFQSTLPARGATVKARAKRLSEDISIHAPCTGSDVHDSCGRCSSRHFNPRSLHGERHFITYVIHQ